MLENIRRSLIYIILALLSARLVAFILILLLTSPFLAVAQQTRARKSSAPRSSAPKESAPKESKPKSVKFFIPDLVTGQKNVEAAMDYNTFKLGLAPGAVVMVEFPARDSILRVHPGDQKLVTVDDTDTAPNYPLIFRPGEGFIVSKGTALPFALITVQMASGIPFVFQVYPVASIDDSASHIVIRYDRDKVVASRRAAGLPVNYKPVPLRPGVYAPEEEIAQASPPPATPDGLPREDSAALSAVAPATPTPTPEPVAVSTSKPQATPTPAVFNHSSSPAAPIPSVSPRADTARTVPISTNAPATSRPAPTPAPAVAAPRPAVGRGRDNGVVSSTANNVRPAPPVTALNVSLRDYMKEVVSDAKAFSKFSKPLYGLSVALSRPKDLNLETRIFVIAVKNTLTESVRLVPGQPDLFIETLDDKKSPVLVEPIQKLGLETTAPLGDLLAPGATAYYAVAFTPPILGTHQYLRISVAQTTAADAPSSVDLTIKSR